MSPDQKKLFNTIVKRWHTNSFAGLTVQQACLDIGTLCGLISIIDPDSFSKELRCDRQGCDISPKHHHRNNPDGEEIVFG